MSSHHIVQRIPPADGYDGARETEAPEPAQITGNGEYRVGPDPHPLTCAPKIVDPDQRIHAVELRMPCQDLPCGHSFERCKAERPLSVMPQDELHLPSAEPAGSIVEQDWQFPFAVHR